MKAPGRRPGELNGEVTVFFALITVVIIALLLMIVESARTEGARLYMTIAANSSIDSLFSQYHRKLWEEYRLLGLEHYAFDQITDEMSGFMKPYFEARNWFPMKLDSVDVEDMRLLTEDEAEYYEKEVLDYMKFGIAATVWDLLQAEEYTSGVREGGSVNDLSDLYDDHAKEAVRLEEAIGRIGECLEEIERYRENAESALSSCSGEGFISAARSMQTALGRIPGLVDDYLRKAEKMQKGLEKSRERLDEEKALGNLTEETWSALDEDFSEYESYVSEDGERRKEISGFSDRAAGISGYLDGLISEAEDIIEYIENWEPSEEEDGEEEELDIDALWEPVRTAFASCDRIMMGSRYGVEDKETEQKLESIQTLLKSSFLNLVLPSGATLSTDQLDMGAKPSVFCCPDQADKKADLTDRLFLTEYVIGVTDYFGRGSFDADSKQTGSGSLETEYVIYGKETDTDNLSETVKTLIEIRTGLNLAYLYTDSTRRNEARTLALGITGAFGLTPLVTVVTFFVLSVWALGQAVCDVRDLLEGGRVPFMHNGESFYLSLSGLLEFASGSLAGSSRPDKGLKYRDYLRILLFFGQDTSQDYRCMDVIQMNLRKTQKDFQMNRLIYSLETNVHVSAAHLFSAAGIVKNQGFDTGGTYRMNVSTAYSY